MKIGNIESQAGKIVYGSFAGAELPTGGRDDIPIIIAQGNGEGSCLWITGSIHGNEYSGLSTIHTLLGHNGEDFPIDELKGTVVLVPTLSPAGLRTGSRAPYFNFGSDPNRMFPDLRPPEEDEEEEDSSTILERVYQKLYDVIAETADYLLDLHNASIGSMPFSFRDPIYYAEGEKADAEALMQKTDEMLAAFGMPIVNEFPSKKYLNQKLHRSVSGAVLNKGRIPAFTVELGSYNHVDIPARDGAVVGCRNVMRWAGMLSSEKEAMPAIPQPDVDFAVRRLMHPRVPHSGVVQHMVDTGDIVKAGDPVARLTDIWGRGIGAEDGILRTEHDGYVVGLLGGTVYYENEPCIWLSVRDDTEMLIPLEENSD